MSEQRPKPYWLIVKYEVSRMDVLTSHLAGGEEALPVFSFEEEAGMFFEHRALGTQWQVRETSFGELVSVLFGPCASAERVALDPLSDVGVEALSYLASMRRDDFLMFLMVKQKLWLSRKERGLNRMVPITRSSKSPLSKQTRGKLSSTQAPRKTSKWETAGPQGVSVETLIMLKSSPHARELRCYREANRQ